MKPKLTALAILLFALASIVWLTGCATVQPGSDQSTQTRNISYSLTITALNALWFVSHGDQTEWDGIVRTISKDVYPAVVLANSGTMTLPSALDMAKDKVPDKLVGFVAGLEAIVGNSRPALDGVQSAMWDWLKGNP